MASSFSLFLALAAAAGGAPPNGAGERTANPREKIICKKFLETGSLVRGYRICKTKAEWDRERDNIRSITSGGGGCVAQDGLTCGQ